MYICSSFSPAFLSLFYSNPLYPSSNYQGMLQQSHIIWMDECNLQTIRRQTAYFLTESPLSMCIPEEYIALLIDRVSSIHHNMLINTGSMDQTGPSLQSAPLDMETDESYYYLLEKVNIVLNKGGGEVLPIPYVGPLSLRNFLECLCRMYKEKSELVLKEENNLK